MPRTALRWEPLYEATQIKGDGETHPFLSPNDEFANFERWDKGNLDLTELKKPEMLEFEYARSALRTASRWKPNSASIPTSSAWSAAPMRTRRSRPSKRTISSARHLRPNQAPIEQRIPSSRPTRPIIMGWEQTASGYAAVWATENTREAIFDAMKRRETYATTGPRMVVRFFGGWDFEAADANNRMPARIGYTKGVPMGGDLSSAPTGKSPTFLVAALKDPIGANLDRIQVIKGWLGKDGQNAGANLRRRGFREAARSTPTAAAEQRSAARSTSPNATWTNTIGAGEMITVWKDPDFDPASARILLCARDRDSDAALDSL